LIERHGVTVGIYHDRLEQARGRAAGSQSAEFLAQYFKSAVHAAPEIIE
jgi:hypothetical protein